MARAVLSSPIPPRAWRKQRPWERAKGQGDPAERGDGTEFWRWERSKTPISRTREHGASQGRAARGAGTGAKCPAGGGALGIHPLQVRRGQAGSVLSGERVANGEVRPMPLKFPPLPRPSPYRARGLASNRCCLSVAFMRPRAPGAGWRSRARTPHEVSPGNGALDAPERALTCGVSPARAPRPPCPPRACSGPAALGPPWGRPASAPSAAASPRPALAGFICLSPPRVKRPAARRVQKPGKGEEGPAAGHALQLPPAPAPLPCARGIPGSPSGLW